MRRNFDTYQEFLIAATTNPNYICTSRYDNGWAGFDAKSYEQALKIAQEGWKAGRSEIRAISDKLNVAGKTHKQQIIYDVIGDTWDIGRVVNGEPECAMLFEDLPEMREGGKIIKIIVNTATSAGIDESVMRKRGAAVISLIEALESVGKRLELWAIFSEEYGEDVRVCIKKADEIQEDDRIAFCLAHPSFSRRFGHSITGRSISPGNPYEIESECDIYLPAMHLKMFDWGNEAVVMNWIKETLLKYGIELER